MVRSSSENSANLLTRLSFAAVAILSFVLFAAAFPEISLGSEDVLDLLPHEGKQELLHATTFTIGTQDYTVLCFWVPDPSRSLGDVVRSTALDAFTEEVLRSAEKTVKKEYVIQRSFPPNVLDEVVNSVRLRDGHSNAVVILKGRDLHDVAGVLRFAWPTRESPKYPAEGIVQGFDSEAFLEATGITSGTQWNTHVDWNDRVAPKKVKKSIFDLNLFDEYTSSPGPRTGFRSNFAVPLEIKNLLVRHDIQHDLVPFLYFFAEAEQLSRHHLARKVGDKIELIGTPSYFLFASDRTKPYYERLRFKPVSDHPDARGLWVMTASREDFIGGVADRLKGRASFGDFASAFIELYRWNWLALRMRAGEKTGNSDSLLKTFHFQCPELLQ